MMHEQPPSQDQWQTSWQPSIQGHVRLPSLFDRGLLGLSAIFASSDTETNLINFCLIQMRI